MPAPAATMPELHTWPVLLYGAALLVSALGLARRAPALLWAAVALLGIGALVQGLQLWRLHDLHAPPALGQFSFLLLLIAWLGVLTYLALLCFVRGVGLSCAVSLLAFVGVLLSGWLDAGAAPVVNPLWSHLHILPAGAGLAALGLGAASGAMYLVLDRELKQKRGALLRSLLPSLEALDRIDQIALRVGFLLLSASLVSGTLWLAAAGRALWPPGIHEWIALAAWCMYALLLFRFGGGQAGRALALYSVLCSLALLAALAGLGVVT